MFFSPCNKASENEAVGEDVVDSALAIIEESLSEVVEDFSLMRRIALVETSFGEESQILSQNTDGGIWQVSCGYAKVLN